jgi:hypothetical protein
MTIEAARRAARERLQRIRDDPDSGVDYPGDNRVRAADATEEERAAARERLRRTNGVRKASPETDESGPVILADGGRPVSGVELSPAQLAALNAGVSVSIEWSSGMHIDGLDATTEIGLVPPEDGAAADVRADGGAAAAPWDETDRIDTAADELAQQRRSDIQRLTREVRALRQQVETLSDFLDVPTEGER